MLSLSLGGINLGETNPPITMAADNAAAAGVVVCVAAGNRNNSDTRGTAAKSLAGPSSSSPSGNSRDEEIGYMESLARQMGGRGAEVEGGDGISEQGIVAVRRFDKKLGFVVLQRALFQSF